MGMNFKEVAKFVPMIFQTNLRPCLLGHTGIGKTEFWKQFCAANDLDLIIIHVAQLEPSDFVGLYRINEDGRTSNCPPNWLPYKTGKSKVVEVDNGDQLAQVLSESYINPNGGVIFLDEINRAHEDMRQALYQFLQDGKIHTYSLPKGDPKELNNLGLPKGKYHISCAANPSSEGYETYEFDPALMNRIAWVNFTPSFEDTRTYLEGKYGRSHVLSWVDSDKGLIDYGDEFNISGLLYSPRMTENHIILFNASQGEGREFRRKVFETIMQKEKVQSFMAYLQEIEYINYKDVLSGLKGEKEDKLHELVKNNRMDVLSTITNDLAEVFENYEMGSKKSDAFNNEESAVKNLVSFLDLMKDELICTFLDGIKKGFNNPKNVVHAKIFKDTFKARMKEYRHVFE